MAIPAPHGLPIALSGMVYANFQRTPEHWLNVTGVDPRHYPRWFIFRNDTVGVTSDFIESCNRHFAAVQAHFSMLTERSF